MFRAATAARALQTAVPPGRGTRQARSAKSGQVPSLLESKLELTGATTHRSEKMSDQIRLREWSRFTFRDPEELIRRFNALERLVADSSTPDSEKALRTNELKTIRETRQAALFALGLRKWAGNASLEIAATEDSDYDAVFRRRDDDLMSYTPVQLKEVVPERWNKTASIDSILKKLVALQSSRDLVIGIHHIHERIKTVVVTSHQKFANRISPSICFPQIR
jgi:hypothetical protein